MVVVYLRNLYQIYSGSICKTVTDKHQDYFCFNEEEWFSDPKNYAVMSGDNIGFAEYKRPGVYWVHFCFDTAKGREAIKLARQMLNKLYEDREVKIVVGLILLENRKARWVIRQVGLKSLGEIMDEKGLCEMFYETNTKEMT